MRLSKFENRRLTVGLLALLAVAVLYSSNAEAATIRYNYSDTANNTAFVHLKSNPSDPPSWSGGFGGTAATANGYTNLTVDDGAYLRSMGASGQPDPAILFNFTITNQGLANRFNWMHFIFNGQETGTGGDESGSCYLANWSSNSWFNIGTIGDQSDTDIIVNYTSGTTIANLVNSSTGRVSVVCIGWNMEAAEGVLADFAQLTIDVNEITNFSNNMTASATYLAGDTVNHTINMTGLFANVTTYVFSWNGTNCNSTWTNSTPVTINSASFNATVSTIIGSTCTGRQIGWRYFANSSNYWTASSIFNYTVATPAVFINSSHNNSATSQNTPRITFFHTNFDGSNCTLFINNTGYNYTENVSRNVNITMTANSTLPDGTYTITINCTHGQLVSTGTVTNYTIDTITPMISNITSTTTSSSAVINFTVNELANATINYGTTLNLPSTATAGYKTTHSITLIGLQPQTNYYYNITSCDYANNCARNGTYNLTTGPSLAYITPSTYSYGQTLQGYCNLTGHSSAQNYSMVARWYKDAVLNSTYVINDLFRYDNLVMPGNPYIVQTIYDNTSGFLYASSCIMQGRILKFVGANMTLVGTLDFEKGEACPRPGMLDSINGFIYFIAGASYSSTPTKLIKINTSSFERVSTLLLDFNGAYFYAGNIDKSNNMMYLAGNNIPSTVVKINLSSFQVVANLTLQSPGDDYIEELLIDESNSLGYLISDEWPGSLIKINLTNLSRIGSTNFSGWADNYYTGKIDADDQVGYFAGYANGGVLKVNLTNLTIIGNISLPGTEAYILTSEIDVPNKIFYVSGGAGPPNHLVRINLTDFTRIDKITQVSGSLGDKKFVSSAINYESQVAYLGSNSKTGIIDRVNLTNQSNIDSTILDEGVGGFVSGIIDINNGLLYFAGSGDLVKINLSGFTFIEYVNLTSVTAGKAGVIDDLAISGFFSSEGCRLDKFNLSALAVIGNISCPSGMNDAIIGGKDASLDLGYFLDGSGRVMKANLTNNTRLANLTLPPGETSQGSMVIDSINQIGYIGMITTPGHIVKINLTSLTKMSNLTLNSGENVLFSAAIDPSRKMAYFGTFTSGGWIVRVNLTSFTRMDNLTISGFIPYKTAVIDTDNQIAYFGSGQSPAIVAAIATANFTHYKNITLLIGEFNIASSVIDNLNGFAYYATGVMTSQYRIGASIIKVALRQQFAGGQTINFANNSNTAGGNWTFECQICSGAGPCTYYNSSLAVQETIPPVISSVVNTTTRVTATVNFSTDEVASSTINYGITQSLGSIKAAGFAIAHSLILSSLQYNTTYYYNITACDYFSNCFTIGPYSFTTGLTAAYILPTIYSSGQTLQGYCNLTDLGANTNYSLVSRFYKDDVLNQSRLISSFHRGGGLNLGEDKIVTAVYDNNTGFGYFVSSNGPSKIIKVNLSKMEKISTLLLNNSYDDYIVSSIIDSVNAFAYFGTQNDPGVVIKVNLSNFQRVDRLILNASEISLWNAVIDVSNQVAYFGTYTSPGRVVKINLTNMQKLGNITFQGGEDNISSAIFDKQNQVAYFGTDTSPGMIVKVNMSSFQRIGNLTLNAGEDYLYTALIDESKQVGYFGTYTQPGIVVRINLSSFQRMDSFALNPGEDDLTSSVMDPVRDLAYFGTDTVPGSAVKVNLTSFERIGVAPFADEDDFADGAIIDSQGNYAYFGTYSWPPRIIRINLSTFQREGSITLEQLHFYFFSSVIDQPNGFAYFGQNYWPGEIIKINLSSFELTASLILNEDEDYLQSAVIDQANQFAYFGTYTSPGRVVKVNLSNFQRVGNVTFQPGENDLGSAVIDTENGFAYFGTGTSPSRVVKVNLSNFQRIANLSFNTNENISTSAVIDQPNGFAYFGTLTRPGRVIKVNLSNFQRIGNLTLNTGEDYLISAIIDVPNQIAYFGTGNSPGRIVKINLSNFQRVANLTLNTGEVALSAAVIDQPNQLAYFGTDFEPSSIVIINLTNFQRIGAVQTEYYENYIKSGVIDQPNGFAYFGNLGFPGSIIKVSLRSQTPGGQTINFANNSNTVGGNWTFECQICSGAGPCSYFNSTAATLLAGGSCTYPGSGNWWINDFCVLTSSINLNGNKVYFNASGDVNIGSGGRIFNFTLAQANNGSRVSAVDTGMLG